MDWVHITPKLVTTRRSTLGPPAEGRPGPSDDYDDDFEDEDDNNIDDHHVKLWPWWQVDNRHHYNDDDCEDEIDNNVDDIIIKLWPGGRPGAS